MFLLYVALDVPFHRTCTRSKIHQTQLSVLVMLLFRYFSNSTTRKNDGNLVPNPQHGFVLITETQCTSRDNRRAMFQPSSLFTDRH